MFAHEILRSSAQSIVEKSIFVCIRFSKCGYIILWSETIFLGTIIARTFTFYSKTRGAEVPGLTRTGIFFACCVFWMRLVFFALRRMHVC
jgi:hypothetical protein